MALTGQGWAEIPLGGFSEPGGLFRSGAYAQVWLSHLAGGPLRVHVDRWAGGQPRAVFPLTDEPERIAGLRRRIWKCVGWNAAWYPLSFVPGDTVAAERFVQYLHQVRADWDGVLVCARAEVFPTVQQLAAPLRLRMIGKQEQVFPYLSLSSGWEAYWATRSPNLRKNVRNLANRARNEGLRPGCVDDEGERDALLGRLFELHRARWAPKGQSSRYTVGAKRRRFLEALVAALQPDGKIWLPYLAIEDRVVAAAVCFVDGETVRYYLPTFDVAWRHLSPGKLLLHHVIRSAAQRGAGEVDLGPGRDVYKTWWATDERRHARAMLFRGDPAIWARYEGVPTLRRRAAGGARAVLGQAPLHVHVPASLRNFVDRAP